MERRAPNHIPSLLQPYLCLPAEQALVLFTGVLGAATNWLVLRAVVGSLGGVESGVKVVLVSFMRDRKMWAEGARRVGLDLDRLSREKKFAFVDGLSGLFFPSGIPIPSHYDRELPEKVLKSPVLSTVSEEISTTIKDLGDGKVVLVIDGLDVLLAAGGEGVNVGGVEDMVMDWREQVHATIMSLSADAPLINSPQTPLETNHAALVLGMAHQADFIMSLRLLDTGTARDVSGIIRITLGEEADVKGRQLEERELLYFVGGDGSVKVFERGQ